MAAYGSGSSSSHCVWVRVGVADPAKSSAESQNEDVREWNSTPSTRDGRSDEPGRRGERREAEEMTSRKISGMGERSG